MNLLKSLFISSFLLLFLHVSLYPQTNPAVTVPNAGFEELTPGGLPSGWNTDSRDAAAEKVSGHSGNSSIVIAHSDYKTSKIYSGKVSLKTGNLYRLSGWIKTENAVTREISQYPTPITASISMASFPFTSHSPAVGSTSDWKKVDVLFIATQKEDQVCLTLGHNGGATGKAWFDDIQIEEVNDITQYIPMETVRWFGNAFRFEDRGWIFVHIEGEPYKRGFQYGYLLAEEIKEYINKLGVNKNKEVPVNGWNEIRFAADAIMLRKYDEEYLTEMKGIADGANKAGMTLFNRPFDLIDIVALNSYIDIDYCGDALHKTPNALTGKSFLAAEDELMLQDKLHKCSAFLATKSATADKRIVYGQIFMWNGYTGPHWNVMVDVQPSEGHRLVYETFPGGIHSGADFYINDAGIMLGETTVNQTPYNPDGTPQSNRIRKAAQYAGSIDDVVKILTTQNNGMYTNDWLIGDTKTDEIAILILGTHKYKLWRSSKDDFYGGQKDWYWSDNNNKSPEVRKEYVVNDYNAPYDLAFRTVNRDLAFTAFYDENYGKIDAGLGINLWNSSPINRPHACDGKVTTSEMAEKLMFFANSGKVTLRETFINENGRVPDLPGATPRFSLGYAVISPILFTEKLKELKQRYTPPVKPVELAPDASEVKELYSFDKDLLWHNTVYPTSEKENWYISGTAAYWNMLNSAPSSLNPALPYMRDELSELNCRLLYTIDREGTLAPVNAATVYNQYKHYQIPRIRGTYLLHQLRLLLGNDTFSKALNKFHDTYREKNITSGDFIKAINDESRNDLTAFIRQWIERDDLPEVKLSASVKQVKEGWELELNISQSGKPYHFISTVMIQTESGQIWKKAEVRDGSSSFKFTLKNKPVKVLFNSGNDIPVMRDKFYTFSNFTDDFASTLIVYGTARQEEAYHTLALRFQKMAADRFTEVFQPVKKDCEVSPDELKSRDLILLGSSSDNSVMKDIMDRLAVKTGRNMFSWNGKTYGSADEGFFAAYPNPYNPKKTVYIFNGNSALQLYNMTKTLIRVPSWALFKKDQVTEKGYFAAPGMEIVLSKDAAVK